MPSRLKKRSGPTQFGSWSALKVSRCIEKEIFKMEIEAIKNRIAELEAGKAALLEQAAKLEHERDEASTYDVLMNRDNIGNKRFQKIIDELVATNVRVAAHDRDIAVKNDNLRNA